jgi:TRAP-type mannitol/chloroaromatic compound transport system permease large subunit
MTEFLIANMAPLMFAALVVFLLLGYPVAFSLAANGLLFGIIAIELGGGMVMRVPGDIPEDRVAALVRALRRAS